MQLETVAELKQYLEQFPDETRLAHVSDHVGMRSIYGGITVPEMTTRLVPSWLGGLREVGDADGPMPDEVEALLFF